MQRLLPGLREAVADWREFTPREITVSPIAGVFHTFTQVDVKRQNGRTIWIGRNTVAGASLVAVSSAHAWHAVLHVPGADSATLHVAGEGASVVPANPAQEVCGNETLLGQPRPAADLPGRESDAGNARRVAAAASDAPASDLLALYDNAVENDTCQKIAKDHLATTPEEMIESTILALVESSNLALSQSNVSTFQWRAVGVTKVLPYVVLGRSMSSDLSALTDSRIATSAFVKFKAEEVGADQVVLFVGGDRDYAGLAWTPGNEAAVLWGTTYLTLAHELGHNFGCSHDRQTEGVPDGDGKYSYGHRYRDANGYDRGTIMSYAGMRVPYFSNPDLVVDGYVLGVPETEPKAAHNARVLREKSAGMVAKRTRVAATERAITISKQPAAVTIDAGGVLTLSVSAAGGNLTYEWRKEGAIIAVGNGSTFFSRAPALVSDAGEYTVTVSNSTGTVVSQSALVTVNNVPIPPTLANPIPSMRSMSIGWGTTEERTAVAVGDAVLSLQWYRDGEAVAGATQSALSFSNFQLQNAGLYTLQATATNSAGSAMRETYPLGFALRMASDEQRKVLGDGREVLSDVYVAASGNTYDQVLLEGAAVALRADSAEHQIVRVSYLDLDDDIVQVEMSGPGTLTVLLDQPSGPGLPANYNQNVRYMKGHARILIGGATSETNLSVFSVGKMTAVNQALFKPEVRYDGIADIAYIAVQSDSGTFGGLRAANAHFFASKGVTGIFAPWVRFEGPVFIGDITAFDAATPMIRLNGGSDCRITGGDLEQANGARVQVSGLWNLVFRDGTDSHGNLLPAQRNRGVLEEDGEDATSRIVKP